MQSTAVAHFALKMNGFGYHIAHIHQEAPGPCPDPAHFSKYLAFQPFILLMLHGNAILPENCKKSARI